MVSIAQRAHINVFHCSPGCRIFNIQWCCEHQSRKHQLICFVLCVWEFDADFSFGSFQTPTPSSTRTLQWNESFSHVWTDGDAMQKDKMNNFMVKYTKLSSSSSSRRRQSQHMMKRARVSLYFLYWHKFAGKTFSCHTNASAGENEASKNDWSLLQLTTQRMDSIETHRL